MTRLELPVIKVYSVVLFETTSIKYIHDYFAFAEGLQEEEGLDSSQIASFCEGKSVKFINE